MKKGAVCRVGCLPNSPLEEPQIPSLFVHTHTCMHAHKHTHIFVFFKLPRFNLCFSIKYLPSLFLQEKPYRPTLLPCFGLSKHFSHGRGQNFHYTNEISTSRLKRKYALQSFLLNNIALGKKSLYKPSTRTTARGQKFQ